MTPHHVDISNALDRILNTAADNLRIAKILLQMGLDPNNITYDAIFNRLLEIVLANITLANMFALVGAIFFVATLLTQTMVPLRVANMFGCAFFAALRRAGGRHQDLSAVSPDASHQCLSPSSNAQSRQEGPQPPPRAIPRWNGSSRS